MSEDKIEIMFIGKFTLPDTDSNRAYAEQFTDGQLEEFLTHSMSRFIDEDKGESFVVEDIQMTINYDESNDYDPYISDTIHDRITDE